MMLLPTPGGAGVRTKETRRAARCANKSDFICIHTLHPRQRRCAYDIIAQNGSLEDAGEMMMGVGFRASTISVGHTLWTIIIPGTVVEVALAHRRHGFPRIYIRNIGARSAGVSGYAMRACM